VTKPASRDYATPIAINAGDRLGTFHMGSSVVMLFEPGRVNVEDVRLTAGKKVRYGESVLHKARS
jgi:phosphatidylserine decarboxylase